MTEQLGFALDPDPAPNSANLFDISWRTVPGGEEALLGANVVGRVNAHDHAKKKRASWISFIPNRVGIRMVSPIEVNEVIDGRRALIASLRAWLHNCAEVPDG